MAATDGPSPQHLSFLTGLNPVAKRYGLFPVLRGAEARAPHLPRIGKAMRPEESIADLSQIPSMAFPAPTIEAIEKRADRAIVEGYWLGLLGPMGPMPLHLTDYAQLERRYARKRPFGRWLDLISNRMLQFFYRAWADSQPAAQADRPADDRFAAYLGYLSGAGQGVGVDAAFPAHARLTYAALFASRRSAVAIEDALSHLLGQRARILEFQPRWRAIEREDQTRLGRSFATLGQDAMAGGRVRVASDAFRVVVRAESLEGFRSLLPSGARFAVASEALQAFAPSHLEWDIAVEIAERDTIDAPARLDGGTALGWTAWLAPTDTGQIRRDAHLRRRQKPQGGGAGHG